MALKYRYDPDLEFFQHLISKDLNGLITTNTSLLIAKN